jgi:hypothetical protein
MHESGHCQTGRTISDHRRIIIPYTVPLIPFGLRVPCTPDPRYSQPSTVLYPWFHGIAMHGNEQVEFSM